MQNRAIRYYLGVHRFAPVAAISGDIGWLPSKYRRWLNMLRYWNRLVKLNDNRITKIIFKSDYEIGVNNWCSDIKAVMNILNLSEDYNNCNLTKAHDLI